VAGSSALFVDQAGRFEDLQMLGNGRTADREPIGEFTDGGGTAAQQVEDSLAGRVGEGCQLLRSVGHTLP